MRMSRKLDRKALAGLLALLSIGLIILSLPSTASAAPTGSYFNRIVIIAMENQNYGSVIGSSSAPFINSLAGAGSTISNYHSYGQNIGGCSAGCYEAFTSGQQSHSDGWCPRASSPCFTISNIADQLHTAGLTSAMFCEDGCPRGADHFPWIAYTSTWNTCVTGSFTCNGQTGSSGNLLYGSSSSNGNSAFINYLNGASPANYIWFTPTDSHNMHDNSVSSGDAYVKTLLVGSGTIGSPSSNSVLGSNLFKTPGTFLYLWWDEYDPSPNVEYGSMIKIGYTSTGGYTEYNSLHTIEANWGLPYITNVVSGDSSMSDIFGSSNPSGLTPSFSYSPNSPQPGQAVTFTASATGGASPYNYNWTFGDGASGTGATVVHTYSKVGPYSVTLTVTDANNTVSSSAQQVTVSTASSPLTTLTFLYVGLIAGGAISVIAYLAKYHARNRKLAAALKEARRSR
jgi:PKD domain-containing protein